MDTEGQTYEQAMLEQARRQTTALESLRGIGLVWISIAGAAIVIWLLVALLG